MSLTADLARVHGAAPEAPSRPVDAPPLSARLDRLTGRSSADLLARLREVERHLTNPALPLGMLSPLRVEREALRLLLDDRRSRAWR